MGNEERALKLDPFSSSGELNVVIETPKGSRNKYKYDEKSGLFRLDKLMPTGTVFPFDFGFLPATRGADGDPLDVLVLMAEPGSVGCLVAARLVGVIEAQQTQNGKTRRNDRLIGVAATSHLHRHVRSFRDLSPGLVDEIERFFVAYNAMQDREFRVLGRHGAARARRVIRVGRADFEGNSKAED
jgi:inorganic pyrophosphatase